MFRRPPKRTTLRTFDARCLRHRWFAGRIVPSSAGLSRSNRANRLLATAVARNRLRRLRPRAGHVSQRHAAQTIRPVRRRFGGHAPLPPPGAISSGFGGGQLPDCLVQPHLQPDPRVGERLFRFRVAAAEHRGERQVVDDRTVSRAVAGPHRARVLAADAISLAMDQVFHRPAAAARLQQPLGRCLLGGQRGDGTDGLGHPAGDFRGGLPVDGLQSLVGLGAVPLTVGRQSAPCRSTSVCASRSGGMESVERCRPLGDVGPLEQVSHRRQLVLVVTEAAHGDRQVALVLDQRDGLAVLIAVPAGAADPLAVAGLPDLHAATLGDAGGARPAKSLKPRK